MKIPKPKHALINNAYFQGNCTCPVGYLAELFLPDKYGITSRLSMDMYPVKKFGLSNLDLEIIAKRLSLDTIHKLFDLIEAVDALDAQYPEHPPHDVILEVFENYLNQWGHTFENSKTKTQTHK